MTDEGARERRNRVLALLAEQAPDIDGLCAACATRLPGINGASVVLMSTPAARETAAASDALSNELENMQYALGEGPCVDAHGDGKPVLVPDLNQPEYPLRWPAFTPAALAAGASALFAFPLRVGAIRLGVLDLYARQPGAISSDALADALIWAEAATLLVLSRAHGGESGSADLWISNRVTVHQATGMVMAQLDVGIEEAFARLRGYAFATGRALDDIADDVVGHRLRFDELEDRT